MTTTNDDALKNSPDTGGEGEGEGGAGQSASDHTDAAHAEGDFVLRVLDANSTGKGAALQTAVSSDARNAKNKANKKTMFSDIKPGAAQASEAAAQKKLPTANKVLIIGIALCVVAAVAIAATVAFGLFGFGGGSDGIKRPYVSDVKAAFESADLHTPDFAKYEYIKTDGLDNATIGDISIGDVYYEGTNDTSAYCNARAQVTWRNTYISAANDLTMKLAYDRTSGKWVDDGVTCESQTVSPASGPDIDALKSNLLVALGAREADAGVASRMSGATIETKGTLNKNGGNIEFILTKNISDQDGEGEGEAASANSSGNSAVTQTATSKTSSNSASSTSSARTKLELTVDESVVWSDETGWIATISSVGELKETQVASSSSSSSSSEQSTDVESSAASQESSSAANSNEQTGASEIPTQQLSCSSGALVQIQGTIEQSGGSWILRSAQVIKVDIDGATYITKNFALTGNTQGLSKGMNYTATGIIGVTGNSAAPVSIAIS